MKNYKVKIKQKFSRSIATVLSTRFNGSESETIGQAVSNHAGLYNVMWQKIRELNGKSSVMFSADIVDVNHFYSCTNNYITDKYNDSSLEITKTLFELIEYKKYMKLYYNSEDIFTYLEEKKHDKGNKELLKFDHDNSNINIYIKFVRTSNNGFEFVSSGYSARLKISKPDLGYFGGLFDDIDFGGKCINRIYSGKPITLDTAF